MQGRLQGKVAIVTGGGTGIGEAICKKFVREGAKVIVAGFNDDPVDDVVKSIKELGGEALAFKGDLAEEKVATNCVKKAVETFGQLDILINNAGVFPAAEELQDYPVDAFHSLLRNNIQTVFMMTRAALPFLQESKGNIVSAGSESGIKGIAEVTPYGGTKAFIHAFMLGLAQEQAKHGVRCNCVCPGPIDTAWTHKETGPMDGEMEDNLIKATPLARRGTPEEVANVYCFLASSEASYVTGALYNVDGGITVSKGPVGEQAPKKVKKQPEGDLKLNHSMDGNKNRKKWINS
ncbi:MAG: SDR family oxidoreductase [Chitinophagaceae bacterium]|nr:MAG: SDR family oxidoreductase [Chitinophagaceae bacterium]